MKYKTRPRTSPKELRIVVVKFYNSIKANTQVIAKALGVSDRTTLRLLSYNGLTKPKKYKEYTERELRNLGINYLFSGLEAHPDDIAKVFKLTKQGVYKLMKTM